MINKYLRLLIIFAFIFFLYMNPSYALSFDADVTLSEDTVKIGDSTKVNFNIKNIKNSNTGISSCEVSINLTDGLVDSDYEVLNSKWKFEKGAEKVIFYSTDNYVSDFKLFSFMVKVNKAGTISFSNIKCFGISDDSSEEESASSADKTLTIKIKSVPSASEPSKESSSESKKSSSSSSKESSKSSSKVFITGFNVKGGTLEFKESQSNYTVYVDSLDNVDADPIVPPGITVEKSDYLVDDNGKEFQFILTDDTGEKKEYTVLFLSSESYSPATENEANGNKKNDYSIYFVAIILILVGLNVYRIIRNKKNVLK